MSIERYPRDLVISKSDFDNSGWHNLISDVTREGYPAMWQVLSNAARDAIEQGHIAKGKVFWLLADACSMTIDPASPNQPFKPSFASSRGRSVFTDDFSSDDIQFFTQIVSEVDENWLRARLSDLLWLRIQPRKVEYALMALDAYCQLPLDADTYLAGSRECWSRALSLARMLKKVAGDRLAKMEAVIVNAFNCATVSDGFLACWLAELLNEYWLGQNILGDIAAKMEHLGRDFLSIEEYYRARDYFCSAADWYVRIGNTEQSAKLKVLAAECWVKEAEASNSSMVAANFYENAIKLYRTIPRKDRAHNKVAERISELRVLLNTHGEKSLSEMSVHKTQSGDLSELISFARTAVTGKSAINALSAFVNLHQGVDTNKLRSQVTDRMRQFPLSAMFASTHVSRDGRVVAKRPALSLGGSPSTDDEIAIRAEMIRDYDTLVEIVVRSYIWPALEEILLEHRLRERDFVELARQSPIVPENRDALFGKALFAGYERDYVVALHLIIPQVEHMVRVQLKYAGATTTNLDKDGIQNENGLSTLMALPEADQIFGPNLAFEIRALFCDAFGANLRNELAHGLLEDGDFHSSKAIYAWWLMLRLTLNSYLVNLDEK